MVGAMNCRKPIDRERDAAAAQENIISGRACQRARRRSASQAVAEGWR